MRLIAPLLAGHRWALPSIVGLGVLASLAEGIGISLFIPLLGSVVEDGGGDDGWLARTTRSIFAGVDPDQRLVVICLAIVGAVAVSAALTYANAAVFASLYARVSHELRSRVHEQILQVQYGWLVRNDTGRLLNVLSTETWHTADAIGVFTRMVIGACTIAVYIALLLVVSWQLTLLVGVALVVISRIVRWVTRAMEGLSMRATAENAVLATRMLESCEGAKVIRAFGREEDERDRFDHVSSRVAGLYHRVELVKAAVNPLYEIFAAVVLVSVLYIALGDDPGKLGSLLVFVLVLYRLQPRVKDLDSNRVALLSRLGAIREVLGILDRDDKPYTVDGEQDASILVPAFRLDGVSFRYPRAESLALDGVTIEIPAGRTTAIVGPSGAGKSTLIDLLVRFYEPESGTITLDGVPLGDLRLATLRARVALVSQDVHLFNTTVRENIAYGQPGVGDDEIERAARLAHAHEFIERLPLGYDTIVGDDGVRLSGGQRQRLTLARAVVRNPDILILDEATNALDSFSEHLVQEAIDLLSGDRTIIVIAHRLATVKRADQIVVLEDGRLVQHGAPAGLIDAEGMFADLWRLQHEAART